MVNRKTALSDGIAMYGSFELYSNSSVLKSNVNPTYSVTNIYTLWFGDPYKTPREVFVYRATVGATVDRPTPDLPCT